MVCDWRLRQVRPCNLVESYPPEAFPGAFRSLGAISDQRPLDLTAWPRRWRPVARRFRSSPAPGFLTESPTLNPSCLSCFLYRVPRSSVCRSHTFFVSLAPFYPEHAAKIGQNIDLPKYLDKIMTIKEKILAFLDAEGIKRIDFFDSVGIVPSNFKGTAKQSELGGDKIAKILSLYPRLSAEWLMRGSGSMIIEGILSPNDEVKISTRRTGDGQDNNPLLIDKLMTLIAERDATIRSQAESIGRLKERIESLEREKNVSGRSFQPFPQTEAVDSLEPS